MSIFTESKSSDQSSDAILADLEADPTTLPGLDASYGFSNPHVVPQTLNARERATGLIGKIVIVLQGRWKEQMVGYRVYRDPSSAQAAYENFSLLNEPELGVHNVDRNNMEVPKDSEMRRYYTGGRCESFVKPNASNLTSARCAALANDRPVIVTALTSQPTNKLVEVTNMIGISPGYFLIGSSGLHALIDAGMRRLQVHASAR